MKRLLLFLSMFLLVGGTTMAFANGANGSDLTRVSNNENGASANTVVQPQNNNSGVKPLEATKNEPVITFTTSKKIGEKINLSEGTYGYYSLSKGLKIEGATLVEGSSTRYVLTAQTVKIIGNCTSLGCSGNGITSIDLSNNSGLKALACGSNKLTSLDLSNNSGLEQLACYSNQLTSLDLSKNSGLKKLYCDSNQLTSLDLSNNSGLKALACGSNKLTSLDLSKNSGLKALACSSNQLTSLDLSKNSGLKELACSSNQLTSLDLSKNSGLTDLSCPDNQLTSLVLPQNSTMTNLNCEMNDLTELDLSTQGELEDLKCNRNALTSLDLTHCENIRDIECKENKITQIQLPEDAERLRFIECSSNNIDVEHMEQLINSLPERSGYRYKDRFYGFVVQSSLTDGNQITREQEKKAKDKGWKGLTVYKYTTPTGISTIDNADASPRKVFDLNGCEVNENQAKGVVIVKQGNKTYKKVVK